MKMSKGVQDSHIVSSVQEAFEADPFVSRLGIEVVEASGGKAVLRATVRPEFANSLGTGHGGFLFTLADTAFAYAILSRGVTGTGVATHMEYLAPVGVGETVRAEAEELNAGNRVATYRVELTTEQDRVLSAHFSGTAYLFPSKSSVAPSENNVRKE